jgi:hypothetical protein
MPNANWSNPTLTSTYTNFVTEVKSRDEDLALQFDGTTSTNLVTNTIRWDSSANRWKKWNGSSWAELTATYALTALTTTGNVGIGTTTPTGSIGAGYNSVLTAYASANAAIDIKDINGNWFLGTTSASLVFYSNTATAERLRIDSTGRLLVGTSTASQARVAIQGATGVSTYDSDGLAVAVGGNTNNPNSRGVVASFGAGGISDPASTYGATINIGASSVGQFGIRVVPGAAFAISDYFPGGAYVGAGNPPTERMRITSAGSVGIGTSAPQARLDVSAPSTGRQYSTSVLDFSNAHLDGATANAATSALTFSSGGGGGAAIALSRGAGYDTAIGFWTNSNGTAVANAATERARIDSSGRLLLGSTTARANFENNTYSALFQVEGASASGNGVGAESSYVAQVFGSSSQSVSPTYIFARHKSNTVGGITAVANLDSLGAISFQGSDGSEFVRAAVIEAQVDGTPGANDMPGRLVFSTTPDGGTVPLKRMEITSNGELGACIPGGGFLYPGFLARAWVNFNGTGTVAIRGNGNVSSITDNTTGDYTVNFTTAMPDANYAVTASVITNSNASSSFIRGVDVFSTAAVTTGSVRVNSRAGGSGTFDADGVFVAIFR